MAQRFGSDSGALSAEPRPQPRLKSGAFPGDVGLRNPSQKERGEWGGEEEVGGGIGKRGEGGGAQFSIYLRVNKQQEFLPPIQPQDHL